MDDAIECYHFNIWLSFGENAISLCATISQVVTSQNSTHRSDMVAIIFPQYNHAITNNSHSGNSIFISHQNPVAIMWQTNTHYYWSHWILVLKDYVWDSRGDLPYPISALKDAISCASNCQKHIWLERSNAAIKVSLVSEMWSDGIFPGGHDILRHHPPHRQKLSVRRESDDTNIRDLE